MEEAVRWYDERNEKDSRRDEKMAADLLASTSEIEQRQGNWYQLNRWNTILLTNRDLPAFHWGCEYRDMGPVDLRSENLVESIGESMVSKAASSPVKPTPVPTGRSYKTERAIRTLDAFQFGVWRQAKAEEAAITSYLDAYAAGIGCVWTSFDGKKKVLRDQAVFFDNLVIDDRETLNRCPPQTYRIRQVVPRERIEATYGVKLEARKPNERYHAERNMGDGYEVLVIAWRLPGPDGEGGAHAVVAGNRVLHWEKWTHDWVPLAFFHWQDPVVGFHPKSGVEQLLPDQITQNELNDTNKAQHDMAARLRLMAHANSSMDWSQWDNEDFRVLMYAGVKPEQFEFSLAHLQHLYQERERNRGAAFSFMGLSEAFGQADLPQNVRMDSSAGIREFRNLEDARHLRRWSRYEQFRLQIAENHLLVLSTSKDADAYNVVYHGGRPGARSRSIPYAAVKEVTKDQYTWHFEATPLSSVSVASTRELTRDFGSRGMGDEGDQHRMFSAINATLTEELEMASYDDILRHLEVLEDGGYEEPTEITNLTYGVKKVTANLHRLLNYEDVPPEVIDNHYNWILAGLSIQQAAVAQQTMTPFQPTQGMAGTSASITPRTMVTNNY
jgi:hypothetical protein